MVHFYLCIDIHTLWSNRLWANPLNNITINDLNANKPCTVKSKMDIYRGKNYKNYTLFLMSGSDVCLWQGQKRFSQKKCWKKTKKKQTERRRGQRKAYLSSFVYHSSTQLCSDFPPWRLSPSSRWQSRRMSAVNTTSLLTVLQEVNLHQAAERFPDQVCCPLSVRHYLILLVWCTNMLQFEWLQPISSLKIQVPKKSGGGKKKENMSYKLVKYSMLKYQLCDYVITIYYGKDTLQKSTIFSCYCSMFCSRNEQKCDPCCLRLLRLLFSNALRPVWKPLPADDTADWGNCGFRLQISAVCWSFKLC